MAGLMQARHIDETFIVVHQGEPDSRILGIAKYTAWYRGRWISVVNPPGGFNWPISKVKISDIVDEVYDWSESRNVKTN